MLAYRLLKAQTQPEFQEVPEPHSRPGQVVVKIAGSGLCHVKAVKQAYDDFAQGHLVGWPSLFMTCMGTRMSNGFALKVRNHLWIQSVQGAVATWSIREVKNL